MVKAAAGGSFPWVSRCEHPPQPVGRVGTFQACSSHVPTWILLAQSAGDPLRVCLWHFSTGPNQALARMRQEGTSSCPPGLFSPSNILMLFPGFLQPGMLWLWWGLEGPSLWGPCHQAECIPASAMSIPASAMSIPMGPGRERRKQEAQPQCSNIPAAVSITHKQPSVPLLGTMSSMPGTFLPCCSTEKVSFFPREHRESIFQPSR